MFKNRAAIKEAVIDTVIGTIVNFPLNVLAMWIIFTLEMSVIQSSIFLWIIFTSIALVRKYYLRVYFENKTKK